MGIRQPTPFRKRIQKFLRFVIPGGRSQPKANVRQGTARFMAIPKTFRNVAGEGRLHEILVVTDGDRVCGGIEFGPYRNGEGRVAHGRCGERRKIFLSSGVRNREVRIRHAVRNAGHVERRKQFEDRRTGSRETVLVGEWGKSDVSAHDHIGRKAREIHDFSVSIGKIRHESLHVRNGFFQFRKIRPSVRQNRTEGLGQVMETRRSASEPPFPKNRQSDMGRGYGRVRSGAVEEYRNLGKGVMDGRNGH